MAEGKYVTIFGTHLVAGLFIALKVEDPLITVLKAFNGTVGFILLITVLGLVEFIVLLSEAQSRTAMILGLLAGIFLVKWQMVGAILLIIGGFLVINFDEPTY